MIGLYHRAAGMACSKMSRCAPASAWPPNQTLGFGCVFADLDLDGSLDLVVANGHIDETVRNIRGNVGYAQPPQLFLNNGKGSFRDAAAELGADFAQPKVGRGLAYGDFDRDGDLDLLMTTNNGPAHLYRNDQTRRQPQHPLPAGRNEIESRRASAQPFVVEYDKASTQQMVKSGSSYLSQSELPLTFGVGKRDRIDRVVIDWPSGQTEEFKNLAAGRAYECVEGKGVTPKDGF